MMSDEPCEDANVECRIMRNGGGIMPNRDGGWYWEVIHVGRTVVARGTAHTKSAARQQAEEEARRVRLLIPLVSPEA